jgi:hypothetical protein
MSVGEVRGCSLSLHRFVEDLPQLGCRGRILLAPMPGNASFKQALNTTKPKLAFSSRVRRSSS